MGAKTAAAIQCESCIAKGQRKRKRWWRQKTPGEKEEKGVAGTPQSSEHKRQRTEIEKVVE
jgi:hypothetical protein